MRVMLVQGTWGKSQKWWLPDSPFVRAIRDAGHTVINGRPFIWDTELGGIGFGDDDLWGWEAAGRYLWCHVQPPCGHNHDTSDLCIIAHSHGRQVVKFACHLGLTTAKVIFVSGPVRKDVDNATPRARNNIGTLVCVNGGREDRLQWLGSVFDGNRGVQRKDPQADIHESYPDSDHSSMLHKPEEFVRVIKHI